VGKRRAALTDDALVAALLARVAAAGQVPATAAGPRQVRAAERALGFPLPPTLRLVLTRVGNGGFGPGGGLMGVAGGATNEDGETIEADYRSRRRHAPGWPAWPAGLLAVCEWGCNVYSCVDAAAPDEPVADFDPSQLPDGGSVADCLFPRSPSLREWLGTWARAE